MMDFLRQPHVIVGLAILVVVAFSYCMVRSLDP